MIAKDIINAIEKVAPRQLQEDYDNAGLQCGDPSQEVNRVLCCMDVTEQVLDEAVALGCQMVVSHHPLLFRGTKCVSPAASDYVSRCLYLAIRRGIVLYAAHTNLDNAPYGVNYVLASRLGLTRLMPLADLPASRLAGLEKSGWSNEMLQMAGSGLIGELPEPMTGTDFLSHVASRLETKSLRYNQDYTPSPADCIVCKVAICGGSGSDFIADAERQQADAYITGEIGYHRLFGHPDLLLIEAGHYETEQHTAALLAGIIQETLPQVATYISETGNQTPIWPN